MDAYHADKERSIFDLRPSAADFLSPNESVNLKYMQNRIEVFEQMLAADPSNSMVMFGLAKEYEKTNEHAKVIALLENYLESYDDEGNAYGVLANAYNLSGNREKAIETYRKGIDVSIAHGHPSMANEYRMTLDIDLAD